MLIAAPTNFEVPYVEKYRPVTLEDVVGKQSSITHCVGNVQAIEQLKSIVKFGNMPNLILVVSENLRKNL
jgi:replication factor C subunit 2/4